MKLIEKWKESWKYTSVQTAVILAGANALFAVVPALVDSVPFWVYTALMSLGNMGIVILRIVAQPKVKA